MTRAAVAAGFTVKRGKKHWKVYAPDGRLVLCLGSGTAGGRGTKNARATLRRHGVPL